MSYIALKQAVQQETGNYKESYLSAAMYVLFRSLPGIVIVGSKAPNCGFHHKSYVLRRSNLPHLRAALADPRIVADIATREKNPSTVISFKAPAYNANRKRYRDSYLAFYHDMERYYLDSRQKAELFVERSMGIISAQEQEIVKLKKEVEEMGDIITALDHQNEHFVKENDSLRERNDFLHDQIDVLKRTLATRPKPRVRIKQGYIPPGRAA